MSFKLAWPIIIDDGVCQYDKYNMIMTVCVCVCAGSARASIVVIFCGVEGSEEFQMAHALLWSQERTVVFVFTGFSFCNYSPTQMGS